ncbi:hypothetical protein ACS0TY_030238 [Phlomoides rotata]
MIASSSIVSSTFSSLPPKPNSSLTKSSLSPSKSLAIPFSVESVCNRQFSKPSNNLKMHRLQTRRSSPQDPPLVSSSEEENELLAGGDGGGVEERDWTTSFLLFAFWAALMYYVFFLAPNQTPVTDSYFLKKLLNLKGEDGFELNEVLVALWYIMGLWPLLYSMLLIPTSRSSKSKIPVWPFVVLSFFGGAYVLIPYFVLWRPPAPPVEESELRRWPLNFLESKLTAGMVMRGRSFISISKEANLFI